MDLGKAFMQDTPLHSSHLHTHALVQPRCEQPLSRRGATVTTLPLHSTCKSHYTLSENGGVHERQAPCRVEVNKLRCDREETICLDRALGVGRIVFRSGENRVRLSIHKIPTKAVP